MPYITAKYLPVICNGTSKSGEACAIIVRFIGEELTLEHCLILVQMISKSMTGQEVERELISVHSVTWHAVRATPRCYEEQGIDQQLGNADYK